jgi:hypothetical protein
MTVRISDTVHVGGFSIRFSRGLGHRGSRGAPARVTVGHRTPLGWTSVSAPVGRYAGKRRASR